MRTAGDPRDAGEVGNGDELGEAGGFQQRAHRGGLVVSMFK